VLLQTVLCPLGATLERIVLLVVEAEIVRELFADNQLLYKGCDALRVALAPAIVREKRNCQPAL
jgi:hypothetical protein